MPDSENAHVERIRNTVSAKSPEEICRLFQQSIAAGDLNSLLSLYDPEAVFLNQCGEVKTGEAGLREVLAPLAAAQARFDYTIRQIIQSGDIALMHTDWQVTSPQPMSMYAIEVARRQPDGTWRWLIGDPFTVGRRVGRPRTGAPSSEYTA
jgi:ketosteroid isomerase-like protein